ncbi:aldehyde dehydrogenase family protein [Lacimicrobium alkaliphilum]|uniref:Aldehyde-dehydrogenase-like protein y4uC n=1 Tax=Lacimicrobium alkaliphilum TaxID=1526571 RepID=A0ABQ1RAW6_9ALTE|nr:aldehyde dehydrogenase family protein [Lacimicrobium alkaliphilum]GGD61174.1 putative aldehyde-dehydrogenase-like protein y4uC [Lacimicrobium alkaliphilum]
MQAQAITPSADTADAQTLLIDGHWQAGKTSMTIHSPYDNNELARVACADNEDALRAISSAQSAFARYRHQPSKDRARLLQDTARLVESRQESFARTITMETGKPITAARKEVSRCINTLTLAAEEAIRLVGETIRFDSFDGGEQRIGYYEHVPLGVVVAITPFNDPLNLAAHKLGPALAAGNTVVLKPSQQAPLSALQLVRALVDCGLEPGKVNVLTGYARDFGNTMVGHKDVAMVTYTGGEASAEVIAKNAGIKKLAMELGANSPVIVMDDCDLERAVDACVSGSYSAVGQNCIGVQRIYVHRDIYDTFRAKFVRQTRQLKVGDPLQDDTDLGPMICEREAIRIENWVKSAVHSGANLLVGGSRDGACYQPTALDNVAQDQELTCQEAFGPVVSLYPFEHVDNAIELANQADYAIHGAVFTSNINTANKVSRGLDVAGVMVNDSTDYRLDAMPFGGARRGSMGREGVRFAIKEMTQTKVMCINLAN